MIGAIAALYLLATGPINAVVAVASPVLYAVTASPVILLPLLARRWTGQAGTTTLTALFGSAVASLASPIGPLLIIAVVLPCVAVDIVSIRPLRGRTRFLAAAAAGALVTFGLSMAVITPELLTPAVILAVLALRVGCYLALMVLAGVIARALVRAGVRPPRPAQRATSAGF